MASQANAIAALPRLDWRNLGNAPPYGTLALSWTFSQSERRWMYVDGAGHNNTGREPFPLSARLYFCNGLDRRDDLLSLWFQEWQPALLDGSPGDLLWPTLGPIRAVVRHVDANVDPTVRSGIIVNVSWSETVEDPEKPKAITEQEIDLLASAKAADVWLVDLGVKYPDGTGSTSIFDLINQIQGAAFLLSTTIEGKLNAAIGTLSSLIKTIDTLTNPAKWGASATLIALSNSLRTKLAKTQAAASSRKRSSVTISQATTLAGFAASVKNSVGDVVELNARFITSAVIPAGTTLRYYT